MRTPLLPQNIVATISPVIEKQINESGNITPFVDYFTRLYELSIQLPHIIIIIIPQELETYFFTNMQLKLLHDKIRSENSKILFSNMETECDMELSNNGTIFSQSYTLKIIASCFPNNIFPFFIGMENSEFTKNKCSKILKDCKSFYCNKSLVLSSVDSSDFPAFSSFLLDICKENKRFLLQKKNRTKNDFIVIAILWDL